MRGLMVMAHQASERGMSIGAGNVHRVHESGCREPAGILPDLAGGTGASSRSYSIGAMPGGPPGSLPKAAIAIAPRPKWKHLPDTDDFVLPITA